MARSDYIYIAFMGELPVAAFTVKLELYQWVKKQSQGLQSQLIYMRVHDGDPQGRVAVVIQTKQLFEAYEKPPKGGKDVG